MHIIAYFIVIFTAYPTAITQYSDGTIQYGRIPIQLFEAMVAGQNSIQVDNPGFPRSVELSVKGYAIFDTSSFASQKWSSYYPAIIGLLATLGAEAGTQITLLRPIGFIICFKQLLKGSSGSSTSKWTSPIAFTLTLTLKRTYTA